MTAETLKQSVAGAIGSTVTFEAMSEDVMRVHVPFTFADGDGLVVRLRTGGGMVEWTDFGHTFMHLSYELNVDSLDSGPRAAIIDSAIRRFGLEDRDGEIVKPTSEANAGNDLYVFCQGLIEIADLRTHTQAKVASTFRADLEALVDQAFGERVHRGWHDDVHDPEGVYAVDFLINTLPRPIALFGVGNDAQAGAATISLMKLQEWGRDFFSAAVHADAKSLSTAANARLTDAIDKQWSALAGHEDDIVTYIQREITRQTRTGSE